MKKLLAAVSSIVLTLFTSNIALADTYKTSDGSVEITGLNANDIHKIAYSGISKTFKVSTVGTCNYIPLRRSSGKGFFPMNSSNTTKISDSAGTTLFTYSGSYIPEQYNIPATQFCNGESRNTNLNWTKIGNTWVIKIINDGEENATFYVTGVAKGTYDATDGFPALRLVTANSCGIAKITNSINWPINKLGNFYIEGQEATYSYSSLPTKINYLCRKGILYKPYP
jgi:hypothetical protein